MKYFIVVTLGIAVTAVVVVGAVRLIRELLR
jgi:hypothetical protein